MGTPRTTEPYPQCTVPNVVSTPWVPVSGVWKISFVVLCSVRGRSPFVRQCTTNMTVTELASHSPLPARNTRPCQPFLYVLRAPGTTHRRGLPFTNIDKQLTYFARLITRDKSHFPETVQSKPPNLTFWTKIVTYQNWYVKIDIEQEWYEPRNPSRSFFIPTHPPVL